MFYINLIIKKFNKLLLPIIQLMESFFNIFKNIKKKKKNNLKNIDKRITLGAGIFITLVLSYFAIPTFYDVDQVKNKLENQISQKYNLEVKFDKKINYAIFPTPHFFIKNPIINYNKSNIANSEKLKIFISFKNFFSFKNFLIKDVFFVKTEFNINSQNIFFFKQILDSNKSEYDLIFKDSILFYKNKLDDVIFFADVNNLKFFYNEEFNQESIVDYKVFNVPFNLNVKSDSNLNKLSLKLKSHKLRLNIENNLNYDEKKIDGLLGIKVINNTKLFRYDIKNNQLNFNSDDDYFNGVLDFKPFYFSSNLNFKQLNLKKLFEENSIILNLIYSEILNNRNLNANLNINFDKIKSANLLSNIKLKTYFEEGKVFIKDSTLDWNNSVLINLDDFELINDKDKLSFSGVITFNFINLEKFYSFYQIKRNYRKNIKKIKLDFLLNLEEKNIQLDNLQIDNISNKQIDNFLNDINKKKINIFNKVVYKNLIKQFFTKF